MSTSDEVIYESGAGSHLDRMGLTRRLCELLEPTFDHLGIGYSEYGQDVILAGNGSFLARLKKLDVKKSNVICMTKFTPDYILITPDQDKILMLDAKVSITPMFFPSAIRKLQFVSKNDTLDHHSIGEIEREAWDNYVNRFPTSKVAICLAAPYHPRLIVAEWATNLTALYRFELDTNVDAAGSGTPHVNLDLNAMRPLNRFLADEFKVEVDPEDYKNILSDIKLWGLNKPSRVNWTQFNNVIMTLHHKCPWLKGRLPKNHGRRYELEERLTSLGITYELF